MNKLFFLLVPFTFLSCILDLHDDKMANHLHPNRVETMGKWGGQGIVINVTDSTTTMEFDCAHALIHNKLISNTLHETGQYGNFIFEKGGPIIIGQKEDIHPAEFRNVIIGDEIVLYITILDKNQPVIKHVAIRNGNEHLNKCL
jgi:hypothetical protein